MTTSTSSSAAASSNTPAAPSNKTSTEVAKRPVRFVMFLRVHFRGARHASFCSARARRAGTSRSVPLHPVSRLEPGNHLRRGKAMEEGIEDDEAAAVRTVVDASFDFSDAIIALQERNKGETKTEVIE
jgi:hypothetical protein